MQPWSAKWDFAMKSGRRYALFTSFHTALCLCKSISQHIFPDALHLCAVACHDESYAHKKTCVILDECWLIIRSTSFDEKKYKSVCKIMWIVEIHQRNPKCKTLCDRRGLRVIIPWRCRMCPSIMTVVRTIDSTVHEKKYKGIYKCSSLKYKRFKIQALTHLSSSSLLCKTLCDRRWLRVVIPWRCRMSP